MALQLKLSPLSIEVSESHTISTVEFLWTVHLVAEASTYTGRHNI
jgi:hypothetical protein